MVEVDLGKVVAKDYEDLSNKPKINGVEISGNLTTEDLNIDLGTEDYEELGNKPSINDVKLSGNKTLEDFGIASKTALEETNIKVDTIIEKADLGIKNTASGEEIHLTDSAEGKAVEFALFGKAKQNTTSGKNLLNNTAQSTVVEGVAFTVNESDGTVVANGTSTITGSASTTKLQIGTVDLKAGISYILSGCEGGSSSTYRLMSTWNDGSSHNNGIYNNNSIVTITPQQDCVLTMRIDIIKDVTVNNVMFKPMIRLASITDDTYEPYTNGASPNPSYPQEIEVSGESYNLLENTATSQTVNGLVFTVNEDKSVTVDKTATAWVDFKLAKDFYLKSGKYILSTGIDKEIAESYSLRMFGYNGSQHIELAKIKSGEVVIEATDDYLYYNVQFGFSENSSFNSDTFYPMIRKSSVKNNRYMPYGKGSVEVKSVGKNLFSELLENVVLTGDDATGQALKVSNNSHTIIGRVRKHTNYTVKKHSDGNRFRIALFKDYPPYTLTKDSKVVTRGNNTLVEYTFNSLDYNYVAFTLNYDNASITTKKAQLERGTVATEYQEFKETLSTIPTPNGLAGIKVDNGGNYTDSNGQQWICDEIVKYADGSGEYVQRVKKYTFIGNETSIITDSNTRIAVVFPTDINISKNNSVNVVVNALATDRIVKTQSNVTEIGTIGFGRWSDTYAYFSVNEFATVEELQTYLANGDTTVYYELATPITTPLTAEQLAEISTFYPVTTISNDADCGMSVEYVGDSIITTNTPIPIIPQDEEMESGDNIVTLFGKIKKKLEGIGKGVVEVVDNLLSTSKTLPLSANQGRVLDEKITQVSERLNVYSTTPKKVGKYINGEDLYEVTVRINVANSEWHDINHGISGITKVVAIFSPINDNGGLMNVGTADYGEWVSCLNSINQTTIRVFAGLHHQGMWNVTFRYI